MPLLPRHPSPFIPSFLESNGIQRRGNNRIICSLALPHGALWAVGGAMERDERDGWEATVAELLLPLIPPPPGQGLTLVYFSSSA